MSCRNIAPCASCSSNSSALRKWNGLRTSEVNRMVDLARPQSVRIA
ncbi:MAG: hypothetical protein V3Q69_11385 [Burkholderia sp.]